MIETQRRFGHSVLEHLVIVSNFVLRISKFPGTYFMTRLFVVLRMPPISSAWFLVPTGEPQ
jgi:hypothetical protein